MRLSVDKYRKAATAAKITDEELCTRTGISKATLEWIFGGGNIELAMLERIAGELGVDAGEIFLEDPMADNENVIEFIKNEKQATLTLSQIRLIAKIGTLAQNYPDEVKILAENEDGTICATIPVSWIKFNPPRRLSEEESERRRKQLESYRKGNP